MREFNNPPTADSDDREVGHFIRVIVQRIVSQARIIGIAAILTALRQNPATHRLA
jgi:hypothetical protein